MWFGIHLIQLKFEYFVGNMLSIVAVSFIGRDIAYSMYVYSSLAALALKHVLLTTIASAFCFSTMFQLNVNGRKRQNPRLANCFKSLNDQVKGFPSLFLSQITSLYANTVEMVSRLMITFICMKF